MLALLLAATQVVPAYSKIEYMIPMRDGAKLYTAVYIPKAAGKHPILMSRTCYSAGPYGANVMRDLPGSRKFLEKGYIYVFQDVRGRYMSEGEFEDVRPLLAGTPTDESTDTYDTADFLVKNVPDNNGRIGVRGISYPGYYTACAGVNSHPAIKAISPQAPVTNWFVGDDFHHHGALFLADAVGFMAGFGVPRPDNKPLAQYPPRMLPGFPDNYDFFLKLGPLSNVNDRYFHGKIRFWNDIVAHPNYDAFWQARDTTPRLRGTKCAVLTVGGFFDAEDMWGALETYRAFEKNNPGIDNKIVMGPWFHGMWAGRAGAGQTFGDIDFGSPTSTYFQEEVEFPFFDHLLNGGPDPKLPEALIFETGTNRWRRFEQWPPANVTAKSYYVGPDGTLALDVPANGVDEYTSDPARPVPFTMEARANRNREYMIADQRFASRRPDVLTYETPPLDHEVTLSGPIEAKLFASTTGSDADFIVKVIDVFPNDLPAKDGVEMGGYQMMVRWEVLRGRFRNSYEKPEPFRSGRVTPVTVHLNDTMHTFRKGHRLMVQVQSSMFPLIDRNPQTYVDIYRAKSSDYRKATIRLYRGAKYPSELKVSVLP